MTKSSTFPIFPFFVLTFFISWGAILAIFGMDAIPATEEQQEVIGMAILLGPLLSSLLLLGIYGGWKSISDLGRRLLRWKVKFRWYLLAILTAPVTTVGGIALLSIFSNSFQPHFLDTDDLGGLLLLGLMGGIIVGMCEEIGWTGYAALALKPRSSIFTSGLIIGLVWGLWHFILFWQEDSFSRPVSFFLLMAQLFSWLPAYRILMVWIFNRTNSLLVAILMHASLVASLAIIDPIVSEQELLIYILIRAALLWILVGILTGIMHWDYVMRVK